jgi:hypothetical protein
MPEDGQKDMMLSEEFLEKCIGMFSGSTRSLETIPKAFQPKNLRPCMGGIKIGLKLKI